MSLKFLFHNLSTRPYTSDQVKLVINFLLDANALLQKEQIDGENFKRHLEQEILNRGVNYPATIIYMRRRFKEFEEIVKCCNSLESKSLEYAKDCWDWHVNYCSYHHEIKIDLLTREGGYSLEYLKRFIP